MSTQSTSSHYISRATDDDSCWKYPLPERPNKDGHLKVSDDPKHEIYWSEYGSPHGEPVMFIHGGPGGTALPKDARFFNPERYRIILFDQRGCGKSRPHAAEDTEAAMKDNDTPHLISDIEKLRKKLNIRGKMHILGGSWGSTLAMAYAIEHPKNVQSLVMRGVFLCRKKDLDYFYQGNAANYEDNPYDTTLAGAYKYFPEAWKTFVEVIPSEKRGDMIKAYAEIFERTPTTEVERANQDRALKAWSIWEGLTSYLSQRPGELGKFEDLKFARAFARLENHYFMNGCFLGGRRGEAWRDNNYLLDNIHRIKGIPVHIVQGQYDQVCPRFQADELVDALVKAGAKAEDIDYRITPAGHSRFERDNIIAQTAIMDQLLPMQAADRAPPRGTGRSRRVA